MTQALHMDDAQANLQYALFATLLFIAPVAGGYLADRYLGFQRAINWGGLLLIVAYLLCATSNSTVFFVGLSLLICASGLFKPNVSAIVGELYPTHDARKDGAFTLFYMGINVGALFPPLIAGTLVIRYGWHSGFLLAAVGMLLGQLIFMLGKKHLGDAGRYSKKIVRGTSLKFSFYCLFILGFTLLIALCYLLLQYPSIIHVAMSIATIGILFSVLVTLLKRTSEERKNMLACLILTAISVGFWSLYNQTFTSLTLFADRNMQHHLFGFAFDAEASQFFNPLFIITISPFLSRLWINLDTRKLNPSAQGKFFLGTLSMALGILLLAFVSHFFAIDGKLPAWMLGCSYLLQTLGELLISPVGLAMVTVLCPKDVVGKMMGVWFFSQAGAFTIGGYLAGIANVPKHSSIMASLKIYQHALFVYGIIGLALTLLALLLLPLINRLTRHSEPV